jgi:hypothetical protein
VIKRKEELYHGPFLHKAPELVVLPRDERISVDSSRRGWTDAFERHDRLDPEVSYGYSGHHGVTGILAAAGPGIAFGAAPESAGITQIPATICRLLGLELEGADGAPIEEILADGTGGGARRVAGVEAQAAGDAPVYSAEEEAVILERLRDLGYE